MNTKFSEDNIFQSSVKYFLISFISLFLISLSIIFYLEKEIRTAQFHDIKNMEVELVQLQSNLVVNHLEVVLSDLHYLHHSNNEDFLTDRAPISIAEDWQIFIANKHSYDQLRYIDHTGDEIIRINKSNYDALIVPQEGLQNKSTRYYFLHAMPLKKDAVYVSPLDLNVENHEVELPYKPILRFVTPIKDKNEQTQGIIVLNYLAKDLLKNFKQIGSSSTGDIMLINSEGFYLSHPDTSQEWGFMFPDKKSPTFAIDYPTEWQKMLNGTHQFLSENGLFTFTRVPLKHKILEDSPQIDDPNIILDSGDWYIVSVIEKNRDNRWLFIEHPFLFFLDILSKNILLFSSILVVSILISLLIYANRKTYLRIKHFSEYDSLTNVYNRRAGLKKINQLLPQDERRASNISLCFIDVNGLKSVNDVLGHNYGDELIITAIDEIKAIIRENDFIIRLGGDEFLLVFDQTDEEKAEKIWCRVVARYDEINASENRKYRISVSHGIVSQASSSNKIIDNLIKVADEKMYEEKKIIKQGLQVLK